LILTGSLSYSIVDRPSVRERLQGRRVEVVELVPSLAPAAHQARRLEHRKVLRNGLSRQSEPVLHRQTGAELEQRLAVAVGELVEDRAPGRRRKRMEDITDVWIIGK